MTISAFIFFCANVNWWKREDTIRNYKLSLVDEYDHDARNIARPYGNDEKKDSNNHHSDNNNNHEKNNNYNNKPNCKQKDGNEDDDRLLLTAPRMAHIKPSKKKKKGFSSTIDTILVDGLVAGNARHNSAQDEGSWYNSLKNNSLSLLLQSLSVHCSWW